MDRIRVSEALDTGSIPVGRAISPLFQATQGLSSAPGGPCPPQRGVQKGSLRAATISLNH